ncbi:S8 family serine peptidase, partial [Flavobacterium sp.]|uniref:S8 family serine peptidase n=1 Tax=Flavobacterium sp. TaxID=239 RepID=UPI00374CB899
LPYFNGNIRDSLLYMKASNTYKENKAYLIDLQKYTSENLSNYRTGQKIFEESFSKKNFRLEEFDSLYKKNSGNNELKKSIWFLRNMYRLGKNLEVLKIDSLKIEEELKFTYNESFYDRIVLGDNELDLKDIHYGSNDMWSKSKKHYHGTIVAGILAANRVNKKGVKGFSDQIKIMAIKTTPNGGSENDKDVALGIRYAVDNGAKIINMSFGKTSCLHPEWIKEAILYAETHDVIVIAGAGNNSWDNDINTFYPIDYDEQTGKEYCSNFIKVGGTTLDGNKYFLLPSTNYGNKTVDIFAPGYFLKTTDPNVGYSYRDGTSMASPIVSGVAALVRSYYPKLTASQVKQIILESGVAYDLNVQVPGEKDGVLKPFREMSKSGKVVNAYNALLMAAEFSKKKKTNHNKHISTK